MTPMTPRGPVAERQWYEIRAAAASPDVTEVFIYDFIGIDWWSGEGVGAKQFAEAVRAIETPQIHLHLNSPGGSVFDGVAIHNALVRHPANVTTFIDGLAASIASVIALAGSRVVMAANALFMIHNPWGAIRGTAADMRQYADTLDKIRDTLVVTYQERTGMSVEDLIAALDAETWFTAEEALAAGFIDEIGVELAAAAHFDLAALGYRNPPGSPAPAAGPAAADPTTSTPGGAPVADASGGAPEHSSTETWVPGLGYVKF